MTHGVALFASVLLFAFALGGQDAVFRADTSLVTLTFSIEKNGRFLTKLAADDLTVLENGKAQRFSLLGPLMTEGTPIDLILLADISSSVADDHAGQVETFLRDVLSIAAEQRRFTVSALAFSDRLVRFTSPVESAVDAKRAANCLASHRASRQPDCSGHLQRIPMTLPAARTASARGSSWIFEAIIASVRSVRPSAQGARRLLLVISDGGSSTSSEPRDAANAAHEENVPVYPIAVGRHPSMPGPAAIQSDRFAQLGDMSGGRSFDLRHSAREIHEAMIRAVLTHAGNQFVVGYRLVDAGRKVQRTAEVKLRVKSLGTIRGGRRTFLH